MKILVTGASGNVGQYVVKALVEKGEKVVVSGTNVEKLKAAFGPGIDAVFLDFTKAETFENALKDVDRVFLMRPPHLGRAKDLDPFLEAAAKKDLSLLAFLSLMGVEKNPLVPHYKIEKRIQKLQIPYVHMRPGFFMQNVSGIHATEIANSNMILIPAGKSKTSFIDAQDIGLAVATALASPEQHRNKAYTLTGSEALDYFQIAQIISRVTHQNVHYANPSFLKYRTHYIVNRGLDPTYVHVTMALYLMTRLGTAKKISNDFKIITGRDPRSFHAFAGDHADLFRRKL